jgi:general secretion pathway protein I
MRSARAAAGFTLLEAIVALVLVGAVMIPLLSFVGTAARGLTTAAETNERSFAEQAAVAILDSVNPMIEPQGSLALDSDVTVSWTTDVLVPPSADVLTGSPLSGYTFGFYRLNVKLARPDRDPWFTFEMRKAGYRKNAGELPP